MKDNDDSSMFMESLAPKEHGPSWESRDFALPCIPCLFADCPANRYGKCEMPSAIKINVAGQCEMSAKVREKKDAK